MVTVPIDLPRVNPRGFSPQYLASLARLEAQARRARRASSADLSLCNFLDALAAAIDSQAGTSADVPAVAA